MPRLTHVILAVLALSLVGCAAPAAQRETG